jgi:hypothetical protein
LQQQQQQQPSSVIVNISKCADVQNVQYVRPLVQQHSLTCALNATNNDNSSSGGQNNSSKFLLMWEFLSFIFLGIFS